jgi:hypothetical protein
MPTAGSYTATIHYYKQSTNGCYPEIVCPNATVSISGNTFTISLGACNNGAVLTSDFSTAFTIYVNLVSNTGGNNYFFQNINGVCTLPLPIVLSSFTVEYAPNNSKQLLLKWTTQQEDNASRFVIERNSVASSSVTNMDIGAVAATNTSGPVSYSFTDIYPLDTKDGGKNWYRLRMEDLDGRVAYSNYVYITCNNCNVTPPQVDCSSYSINGPSYLCSGTADYAISNQLFYNKYTWSTDNTYALLNSNTGPATSLTQWSNGLTTLQVTLSRCTSGTATRYKTIEVGKPVEGWYFSQLGSGYIDLIPDLMGNNYVPPGLTTVHISKPAGYTPTWSYLWGSVTSWSSSNGILQFTMPSGGDATFQVDVNTPNCGMATEYFTFVEDGSYSYYSLSPNPATSQVSLYVDDHKLQQQHMSRQPEHTIQQVIVTDRMGNTVLQQKYAANTSRITLNIAALKTDMYTIRVFNGKSWKAMKFIKR